MTKRKHGGIQDPQDSPNGQIIYRHLGDLVAADCEKNLNWQVEYHERRGFPVGLAWVLVPPAHETTKPMVKFVLVTDDSRKRGIGTRLIEACRQRWPEVTLSLPTSPEGEALFTKFHPSWAPEEIFNEDFIAARLNEGMSREELEAMAQKAAR